MNMKKIHRGLALLLVFLCAAPAAARAVPLSQTPDAPLQGEVERALGRLALTDDTERGALALTLVDITDRTQPKLAEVNGDRMMYAASLPKIAILLGAFQRIEDGALAYDGETREHAEQMIRRSDNPSATWLLERVGIDYLAGVLRSARYRLYDIAQNGGLWVGKFYSREPALLRDPLHNLSHGATALQVARFYHLLDNEELVSPTASREMKRILGEPEIRHKFVKGLSDRPQAHLFRKSGSWGRAHCDSALVEHAGRRYIAVALADDARGGEWLPELIRAFDDIIAARHPEPLALHDGAR